MEAHSASSPSSSTGTSLEADREERTFPSVVAGTTANGATLVKYVMPHQGMVPETSDLLMETLPLDTSQSPSLGLGSESGDEKECRDTLADTEGISHSKFSGSQPVSADDKENLSDFVEEPQWESLQRSPPCGFDRFSTVDLDESLPSITEKDENTFHDDTVPVLGDVMTFLSPIMLRRDSEEDDGSVCLEDEAGSLTDKEIPTIAVGEATSVCEPEKAEPYEAGAIPDSSTQRESVLGVESTHAIDGSIGDEGANVQPSESDDVDGHQLDSSCSSSSSKNGGNVETLGTEAETVDSVGGGATALSVDDSLPPSPSCLAPENSQSASAAVNRSFSDERQVIAGKEFDTSDSLTISSWNETKSLDGRERVRNGGSPIPQTYKDLTSAKKHLNDSSRAFTESLRDAAHRRKMKMTRSRDSLAAKEKQHLLSLENERAVMVSTEGRVSLGKPKSVIGGRSINLYQPFKARPVPSATGRSGTGGQVGVPRVEKKPTTTAFSPQLGFKRRAKAASQRGHGSRPDQPSSTSHSVVNGGRQIPFRARPVPRAVGAAGHGGQAGVPKVPKRQPTVPSSPLLGFRRRSTGPVAQGRLLSNALGANEASPKKDRALQDKGLTLNDRKVLHPRPLPNIFPKKPVLARGGNSPALRGLDILHHQRGSTEENRAAVAAQTPRPNIRAYMPYSTIRATKRADFDDELARNEHRRLEEKRNQRKSLLLQKRAEVDTLRPKLR